MVVAKKLVVVIMRGPHQDGKCEWYTVEANLLDEHILNDLQQASDRAWCDSSDSDNLRDWFEVIHPDHERIPADIIRQNELAIGVFQWLV